VALSFAAVAIPLQLQKEWITLGWALEGLAVIALWRRLDHPGPEVFRPAPPGSRDRPGWWRTRRCFSITRARRGGF